MQKNTLVIRFGSLGDVILTSATVLNLKLNNPDSRLTYLTREHYKSLVACFDGVDEIITLPADAGPMNYINLLKGLDNHNFDSIVDLHGSIRSWLARKMLKSNDALVYPKRRLERQAIIRRRFKRIPDGWPHTIDLYNDCVEHLGGTVFCRRPVITPPDFDDLLEEPCEPSGRRVVIAPGAAHPNKQWGMEKYAEVARQLHGSDGCRIIWAVTSEDHPTDNVRRILTGVDLTELVDYPFERLAAVIRQADLTIANDSGLTHLSSAVGTPVISVFGPTHQSLGFAPKGLFDRVVEVEEDCRPCSLHGRTACYREERFCFTRIKTDVVYRAASELMSERSEVSPGLFVDRDGTVIEEKNYLADPDQVQLIAGAAHALKLAREAGYRIVIVSNQSGVARGYFTVEQAESVNARTLELLNAEGVKVDGIYYCPYYKGGSVPEFAVDSDLRKPKPGMVEQAAEDLRIDLRRSLVIGDHVDDVNLGRVAGARSFLVRTGHGREEESRLGNCRSRDEELAFDDILTAVTKVLG
jgi:histidinol-phosphate phosphatase family protein